MAKDTSGKYDYNRFGAKGQRVGQAILDIVSKDQVEQSAEDIVMEFGPEFEKEFRQAVAHGSKHYSDPFYVFVLSKKEMWACNLMRNFFIPRQTSPRGTDMIQQYPHYMKTLYKVYSNADKVDLVWSVPGHAECQVVARNPSQYDPELVQFIFQCYEGKLDREILK